MYCQGVRLSSGVRSFPVGSENGELISLEDRIGSRSGMLMIIRMLINDETAGKIENTDFLIDGCGVCEAIMSRSKNKAI